MGTLPELPDYVIYIGFGLFLFGLWLEFYINRKKEF